MKRIAVSLAVIIAAAAFLISSTGASTGSAGTTYRIQLDNAFGLVKGADFKVSGVRAGAITGVDLDQKTLHAVISVSVTQPGLRDFHSDVFCQTRPQSLIGEYFVDCNPGTQGAVLPPGSTIPVTRTQATIPADLLNNIMRLPYRQRFSLLINELGAAVAGRSQDLQTTLQRAVPALTETDNLLNLLANDSARINRLTVDSDTVVTSLANNSKLITRWIQEAGRQATDTATQDVALQQTFRKLPGFLEQLRPNMVALGASADANTPLLNNLNSASSGLTRLFRDLPGFAQVSLPSLRSLGTASVTGRQAVIAAKPTITDLNNFARLTPELAGNLAIVLHHLDDRNFAVEKDPRSPGGKGYTGLEALLQYVFNQALAINTFSSFGHQLTVDAFYNSVCSPYTVPQDIATNLAKYQSGQSTTDPRKCLSWIGPNQPGVNTTDPSNPSACVPLPGYVPPGRTRTPTMGTPCRLAAAADHPSASSKPAKATDTTAQASAPVPVSISAAPGGMGLGKTLGQILGVLGTAGTTVGSAVNGAVSGATGAVGAVGAAGGAAGNGGLTGAAGSAGSAAGRAAGAAAGAGSSAGATATSASGSGSRSNQTQTLLNYLLAP